jgi:hypothetical protein
VAVTLGTFGATDATGWTQFTPPSGGAHIYYVSYQSGNDGNDGLTVNTPLKSINGVNGALSKLTVGRGDWILFKKGDTWPTGDVYVWTPQHSFAGLPGQPIVFGSYDPAFPGVVNPATGGNRPLLKIGQNDSGVWAAGFGAAYGTSDYIAIVGLDIYATERDPLSADYVSPVSYNVAFLNHKLGFNFFLFEDCRFVYLTEPLAISYQPIPTTTFSNLIVRRCCFINSYSATYGQPGNTADDVFCVPTKGLVWEENIHTRCGWNHIANTTYGNAPNGSPATYYEHAIYFDGYVDSGHYSDPCVSFSGNILDNDSDGQQLRSGGKIFNNFFMREPTFISLGCPIPFYNTFVHNVTYNVCTVQVDRTISDPGWAASGSNRSVKAFSSFSHAGEPQPLGYIGTVNYSNNINCNSFNSNGLATVQFDLGWSGTLQNNILYWCTNGEGTLSYGTQSVVSIKNVTGSGTDGDYNVPTSGGSPGSGGCRLAVHVAGGVVTANVALTDGGSDFWNGGGGYSVNDHLTATIPGGSVACDVQQVSNMSALGNFLDEGGTNKFSYPLHGGYSAGTPMGNTTIEAYAASIGLSASGDAFITAATGFDTTKAFSAWGQGQCRANWQAKYTAAGVNSYFRAGFRMPDPGGPPANVTGSVSEAFQGIKTTGAAAISAPANITAHATVSLGNPRIAGTLAISLTHITGSVSARFLQGIKLAGTGGISATNQTAFARLNLFQPAIAGHFNVSLTNINAAVASKFQGIKVSGNAAVSAASNITAFGQVKLNGPALAGAAAVSLTNINAAIASKFQGIKISGNAALSAASNITAFGQVNLPKLAIAGAGAISLTNINASAQLKFGSPGGGAVAFYKAIKITGNAAVQAPANITAVANLALGKIAVSGNYTVSLTNIGGIAKLGYGKIGIAGHGLAVVAPSAAVALGLSGIRISAASLAKQNITASGTLALPQFKIAGLTGVQVNGAATLNLSAAQINSLTVIKSNKSNRFLSWWFRHK